MFAQHGRAGDLSMCCSRPNGNCTITELDPSGDYANDVYQTGRCVKTELHIPQQSLAAREQHRSICGSKNARFVDRTGAMIDKFTHGSHLAIARAPAAIAFPML